MSEIILARIIGSAIGIAPAFFWREKPPPRNVSNTEGPTNAR